MEMRVDRNTRRGHERFLTGTSGNKRIDMKLVLT